MFLSQDQDAKSHKECAEAQQVHGPESIVLFHKDGECKGKCTDIDAPVEDEVYALICHAWILYHSLARPESLDLHPCLSHLLGNER